jgi:peroxiredoxin Q/BCP
VVFGISADSPKTQAGFKAKQGLPFTLLSDKEKKVADAYGARKLMGVARTTYVIGEDGRIRKVFPSVSPRGHASEVLEAL